MEGPAAGTLANFAADDIHQARVIGQMSTEPYASARRVCWVVDNGSSHNGKTSIVRMKKPERESPSCICRSLRSG